MSFSLDDSIDALDALGFELLELENRGVEEEFENLTGQMMPVRDDQVENNVGGFVFQVTDETRIRRFLILGTSAATYYVSQSTLEKENIEDLIRIINEGKGHLILREVYEVTRENRAPKRDFAIYAIALAARYKTKDFNLKENQEKFDLYMAKLQKAAFKLVPHVCRISTDLFMFLKYAEEISEEHQNKTGWGRMMRATVANWYLSKAPKRLALQLTKYKNRQGYTHKDALRLCHADPQTSQEKSDAIFYDYLFNYAVSGNLDKKFDEKYTDDLVESLRNSQVSKFMEATIKVSKLGADNEAECASLIREHELVREHIPTDLLNCASVWEALLEKMPMTAMIRNLAKMSVLDLITGEKPENEKWVKKVVDDLTNEQKLKKAGIHPLSVLLAKSVYENGRGMRGSLTFKTNPVVLEALEKSFMLAFKNVKPTNKRYCIAMDVSGSMSQPVAGTLLECYYAEIAMAMVALRTEPKCEVVAFSRKLTELKVNAQTTFKEFHQKIYNLEFSDTDCSLPMVWAKKHKKEFDVFIVFTDNETYFGNVHPFDALRQYRESSGIKNAKLIVVAFTATKFTIADPTDRFMLDVVGFDSSTPELISNFVMGRV